MPTTLSTLRSSSQIAIACRIHRVAVDSGQRAASNCTVTPSYRVPRVPSSLGIADWLPFLASL